MNQSVTFAEFHHSIPTYPIKLVSKSLPVTRAARLRLSWFGIGLAFGLGCNVALMSGGNSLSVASSEDSAPSVVAEVASKPLPVLDIPSPGAAPVVLTKTEAAGGAAAKSLSAADSKAMYPVKFSVTLQKGDTLSTLMDDAGVAPEESYSVVEALRKHFDPRKINVGQDIEFYLDKHPNNEEKLAIKSVLIPVSVTSSYEVTRDKNNSFNVKKLEAKMERKLAHVESEISGSLYESALKAGIPASMVPTLIKAFSYDVDFQRDVKEGDTINVLYEKLETEKGESAGNGNLLFAELKLGKDSYSIYRYVDSSDTADYYNAKGESVRKGLLRTPINGATITSRFGMRRHPILGYSKMHRGVDFGAPTGTPIYAAGDGRVDFVGRHGGYGNYLRIQHNSNYSTAYAHISRFASGIRQGGKVKQGQIIAYVGTTGNSTGPHLHYEVLSGNTQVNPANIKFKTGTVLTGKELASFKKNIAQVEAMVASVDKGETKVAQLSSGKQNKSTE